MSIYAKRRQDGTTAWYYDLMFNKVRYQGVGGPQRRKRSEPWTRFEAKCLVANMNLKVERKIQRLMLLQKLI